MPAFRPSFVVLILLVLGLPGGANAAFAHLDDRYFGPGSIILDERTGLQWLRMDLSTLSPAEWTALASGKGEWARFRLASEAELETLLRNAGVLPLAACPRLDALCINRHDRHVVDAVKIVGFQAILGATHAVRSASLLETNGRLSGGAGFYLAVSVHTVSYGRGLGCIAFEDCDLDVSPPFPGNWIVRRAPAGPRSNHALRGTGADRPTGWQ